jgi:hypothetical protein
MHSSTASGFRSIAAPHLIAQSCAASSSSLGSRSISSCSNISRRSQYDSARRLTKPSGSFAVEPPLYPSTGTTITPSSTAFQNSFGSQITLPFSGEYEVNIWAEVAAVAALTATLGVNIAGSALIQGASKVMVTGAPNSQDMSYVQPFTAWAAGTVLNTGYQTSAANDLFIAGRVMEVLPRRVGP